MAIGNIQATMLAVLLQICEHAKSYENEEFYSFDLTNGGHAFMSDA